MAWKTVCASFHEPQWVRMICASWWWEKDIEELKADEEEFAGSLKDLK